MSHPTRNLLLALTLMLLLALLATSPARLQVFAEPGQSVEEGTQTTTVGSWTLLIYAAADNDLDLWMGENPATNGMLYRLQRAGPQANVQVAVLYDGPTADDTRRYTLDAAGVWVRTNLPEARMDEPETLRDFINWGFHSLPPSDYYALAILSHANAVVGIALDESSKDLSNPRPFLTPLELHQALSEATTQSNQKLDVIFYDASSFGLFENIMVAADVAHFVIAAPGGMWGSFAYEDYRRLARQGNDPRSFAVGLAQHYATSMQAVALPYTIAVFDLAYAHELQAAISALGQSLLRYVQADPVIRRETLRMLRTNVQKYDSGQGQPFVPDNADSYVDVIDLASKLRAAIENEAVETASERILALAHPNEQRFVVYESHMSGAFFYEDQHDKNNAYTIDFENVNGLGLYYPLHSTLYRHSAFIAYVEHRLFPTTAKSSWTSFIGQGIPPHLCGWSLLDQLQHLTPLCSAPAPLLNDHLVAPFIPMLARSKEIQQRFLPLIVR